MSRWEAMHTCNTTGTFHRKNRPLTPVWLRYRKGVPKTAATIETAQHNNDPPNVCLPFSMSIQPSVKLVESVVLETHAVLGATSATEQSPFETPERRGPVGRLVTVR